PPWYLLEVSWAGMSVGALIEHSHRAMGHVIGVAVIVLAVALVLRGDRSGWRWLGVAVQSLLVLNLGLVFAVKDNGELWAGCMLVCLGLCVGVVAVSLGRALRRRDDGSWLVCLGMLALAGVIGQGLLGGLRVRFNPTIGTQLRVVHGCLAQLLLALL